jgi:hypothetical protein
MGIDIVELISHKCYAMCVNIAWHEDACLCRIQNKVEHGALPVTNKLECSLKYMHLILLPVSITT